MCYLAILKEGAALDSAVIDSVLRINTSGVGIVKADGGCLRWLTGDNEARAALVALRGPAIVHARMATVGEHSWANVHPYQVKWGAFAHNGTLSKVRPMGNLSDSATLASHLSMMHAAGALAVLDLLADSSNKFAAWSSGRITEHGQFSDAGHGVRVSNLYSWDSGRMGYTIWDDADLDLYDPWSQTSEGGLIRDTNGALWARRADRWTMLQPSKSVKH